MKKKKLYQKNDIVLFKDCDNMSVLAFVAEICDCESRLYKVKLVNHDCYIFLRHNEIMSAVRPSDSYFRLS